MPFALFHFDRATHYAVLGNLIAMPVMGFWVMPAAALAVMLMPFGAQGPALVMLGKGIVVMMAMGRWVSNLPGAVSLAPAMPLAALVLISLGGLWTLLWQKSWRWWGLMPMLIGCVWAGAAPRPTCWWRRMHRRWRYGGQMACCILCESPRTALSPANGCGATVTAATSWKRSAIPPSNVTVSAA